jgi:hypothetical protein
MLSLKIRNGIYNIGVNVLIHRKFVSGSGECDVSVVTKCSYRQKCGFQNHFSSPSCKLPACEGKWCYQCKISKPWKCAVKCKFSATIKQLMVKWNNFWNGLYSDSANCENVSCISAFNNRPPLSNNKNKNLLHQYLFYLNFKQVSQTIKLHVHFATSAEATVTSIAGANFLSPCRFSLSKSHLLNHSEFLQPLRISRGLVCFRVVGFF